MITVIGIGNGEGDLTYAAAKKIKSLGKVYLRSAQTKAGKALIKEFGEKIIPLDYCYAAAQSFDELNGQICAVITQAASSGENVGYAADGDGLDGIAAELIKTHGAQIIYGVAPNSARGEQNELRITAAAALEKKPYLDTSVALHVTEIDDPYVAGDLKLWLMNYYADSAPVNVCIKNKLTCLPLYELDRLSGYDYSCEISIDAQEGFVKDRYGFADLLRIMQRLTAPGGCPWDTAQTHESIRTNMIEEAYEAVDAINSGDADGMVEEFGDVLLQAVFHCDMGRRQGEFDTADVISALCSKLVGRHTHIFGSNRAENADEALVFWEQAKSAEKSYTSTADKINRIPDGFPSLLAAQKIYKKLLSGGVSGARFAYDGACSEDEGGLRLFELCAQLSACGVDAEVALHKLVCRIKKEFAAAEQSGSAADFLDRL